MGLALSSGGNGSEDSASRGEGRTGRQGAGRLPRGIPIESDEVGEAEGRKGSGKSVRS